MKNKRDYEKKQVLWNLLEKSCCEFCQKCFPFYLNMNNFKGLNIGQIQTFTWRIK